jgi:hypothetical protein
MRQSSAFFLFCALLASTQVCPGQQSLVSATCSLPVPPLDINRPNLFSAEQEQWLGQAQANELEADYDLIPEKESAELERIGQNLLAQLPPHPFMRFLKRSPCNRTLPVRQPTESEMLQDGKFN